MDSSQAQSLALLSRVDAGLFLYPIFNTLLNHYLLSSRQGNTKTSPFSLY